MAKNKITTESGIYQIRCLANNKIYIGSTVNLRNRWKAHRNHLSKGLHHSVALQGAWNKYGKPMFVFEVLMIIENKEDLVPAEQYWIDRLQSFKRNKGYNCSPTAGSCLGVKHTEETCAKLSALRRGVKQGPRTEEARRNMSEAGKRRRPPTEKARANMSKAHKGKKRSPKARAAMKAAQNRTEVKARSRERSTGRKHTLESRQKMSEIAKNRIYSDERRRNMSIAAKNRKPATEETRAKLSASSKARVTPESFTRLLEFNRSPEGRAKSAAVCKARLWTPEERETLRKAAILREAKKRELCRSLDNPNVDESKPDRG